MRPAPFCEPSACQCPLRLPEPAELFEYGRAFLFAVAFCRVLLECRCQSVGVTSFEENKVLWNLAGLIFFQSEVHAVFPRNSLKVLDILISNLNIGNALVLSDKFLYALLSTWLNRSLTLFFLAVSKIL